MKIECAVTTGLPEVIFVSSEKALYKSTHYYYYYYHYFYYYNYYYYYYYYYYYCCFIGPTRDICFGARKIKEALEIYKRRPSLNRDKGVEL